MRSSQIARVQAPASPNLVPMIDVLFVLLLFLLLGADMALHEREDLRLAEASQVRASDMRTGESTLNVHHAASADCAAYALGTCRAAGHWRTSIAGTDCTGTALDACLRALAGADPEPVPPGHVGRVLSARALTLRADRGAPYGEVQHALESCGAAGLYRLSLAAAEPAGR